MFYDADGCNTFSKEEAEKMQAKGFIYEMNIGIEFYVRAKEEERLRW